MGMTVGYAVIYLFIAVIFVRHSSVSFHPQTSEK